jgi:hypothetical protein
MSETSPLSVEQARAALEEASVRARQVRRSDRQLSWMLLLVAGIYIMAGVLVSVSPEGGRSIAGPAVLGILAVAIGAAVVVGFRIKAFSQGGIAWYFATMIAFNLWNAGVVGGSVATRFWALGQPAYHFGISAAVAVLPLLAGAWLLGRRR